MKRFRQYRNQIALLLPTFSDKRFRKNPRHVPYQVARQRSELMYAYIGAPTEAKSSYLSSREQSGLFDIVVAIDTERFIVY